MTAVASPFNRYSMRQGACNGRNATSFGWDLKRFPVLIFSFVMAIPNRSGSGWLVSNRVLRTSAELRTFALRNVIAEVCRWSS